MTRFNNDTDVVAYLIELTYKCLYKAELSEYFAKQYLEPVALNTFKDLLEYVNTNNEDTFYFYNKKGFISKSHLETVLSFYIFKYLNKESNGKIDEIININKQSINLISKIYSSEMQYMNLQKKFLGFIFYFNKIKKLKKEIKNYENELENLDNLMKNFLSELSILKAGNKTFSLQDINTIISNVISTENGFIFKDSKMHDLKDDFILRELYAYFKKEN